MKEFYHPTSNRPIKGERLLTMGDEVHSGDFYASSDGCWRPWLSCPESGVRLKNPKMVWVRPAPATKAMEAHA